MQRTRSGQHAGWDNGDEKWIHRLHELEKRLKAEREGRLLDRSGARKRLEERDAENQKLRAQIQRDRVGRGPSGAIEDGRNRTRGGDERPSSSEGEGFAVDIEM